MLRIETLYFTLYYCMLYDLVYHGHYMGRLTGRVWKKTYMGILCFILTAKIHYQYCKMSDTQYLNGLTFILRAKRLHI